MKYTGVSFNSLRFRSVLRVWFSAVVVEGNSSSEVSFSPIVEDFHRGSTVRSDRVQLDRPLPLRRSLSKSSVDCESVYWNGNEALDGILEPAACRVQSLDVLRSEAADHSTSFFDSTVSCRVQLLLSSSSSYSSTNRKRRRREFMFDFLMLTMRGTLFTVGSVCCGSVQDEQ